MIIVLLLLLKSCSHLVMVGVNVSPFITVGSSLAPYRKQKKECLVLKALGFQLLLLFF